MMTAQLELSILAAPLGAIDRRVLPQAWYDALGVAQSSAGARHGGRLAPISTTAHSVGDLDRSKKSAAVRFQGVVAARGRAGDSRCTFGSIAGETPADRAIVPLSRRIERRFAGAKTQPRRATFSLGRGSARIHIVLQTTGSTATLLAICRPEMRAVVARALAGARLALAARGLVADVLAGGVHACS